MCYDYKKIRDEWLFTDEGQRYFLSAREVVLDLLRTAGAIRALQAINAMPPRIDTWEKLSCLDRMEEIGELVRVCDGAAIQGRIYKFRDYSAIGETAMASSDCTDRLQLESIPSESPPRLCKNCKYRSSNSECLSEFLVEPDTGFGGDKLQAGGERLFYGYNESGGFYVEDNFGCIHFEPKPETKPTQI